MEDMEDTTNHEEKIRKMAEMGSKFIKEGKFQINISHKTREKLKNNRWIKQSDYDLARAEIIRLLTDTLSRAKLKDGWVSFKERYCDVLREIYLPKCDATAYDNMVIACKRLGPQPEDEDEQSLWMEQVRKIKQKFESKPIERHIKVLTDDPRSDVKKGMPFLRSLCRIKTAEELSESSHRQYINVFEDYAPISEWNDKYDHYDGSLINGQYNDVSGSRSSLLIGGVVGASSVIIIMLIFCIGLAFGMLIYCGYSQERALERKRTKEAMHWIEDENRNEV
eukprot:376379_1